MCRPFALHAGPDLVLVLDRPPAHQMVLRGVDAESQAYERDEAAA